MLHADLRVELPNLCSMEINEIRPFFVRGMSIFGQLQKLPAEDDA
jgi:GINS complex subunit 2